MQILGLHSLIELSDCNSHINDVELMERVLTESVNALGATLISLQVHNFQPQGVTAFALLEESHLSMHSWPEYNYLAVDFFTCGSACQPDAAIEILKKYFEPGHVELKTIQRGISAESNRLSNLN